MCLWSVALKARKAANWLRTFFTGKTALKEDVLQQQCLNVLSQCIIFAVLRMRPMFNPRDVYSDDNTAAHALSALVSAVLTFKEFI